MPLRYMGYELIGGPVGTKGPAYKVGVIPSPGVRPLADLFTLGWSRQGRETKTERQARLAVRGRHRAGQKRIDVNRNGTRMN